ncbi:hypothetical protein IFM89_017058 [Coptis chinensis]|uniref:RING-type domain-containing protein n=1 Tax=Coptis chinensis TaxID=261450 RepID=A0A835HQA5_9MAGN|nr:hypothetical protein IFM89_017058 [Coptis chinensis]
MTSSTAVDLENVPSPFRNDSLIWLPVCGYIEAGTLMNNYAHIFDLLTRLRQAVDHPYLVIYHNSAGSRSQNNTYISEQECGICHDPAEDPVVTSCEHVFCKACLTDYAAALGQVSCPSCSKPLTAARVLKQPLRVIDAQVF